MHEIHRFIRCVASVLVALGAFAAHAQQDAYPSRPVRIIVPFPPAGPSDVMTRLVAERLSDEWKQPVLIENRAGAGGNIGMGAAAKAPADGYTLVLASTATYAVNPTLYKNLPFDANRDFVELGLLAKVANVLLVNPAVPATSLKDLVALIKTRPGKLAGGYPGAGNSSHISLAMFQKELGLEVLFVPYKGGADSMNALIAGQTQMNFELPFVAAPQVRAGKLRAVAIAGPVRSTALPDVPTFEEAGYPGFFDTTAWFGMLTNAGVPAATVRKLNESLNRATADAKLRQYLTTIGASPAGGSAGEFAAFVRAERVRWAKAVKESGAQAD